MARLPVVVGFGGVNPAGRSSFHHAYRRMIFDALDDVRAERTLRSLAALTGRLPAEGGLDADGRQWLLQHSLVRELEADWFDPDHVPLNRRLAARAADGDLLKLVTRARNLPDPLPANWNVADLGGGQVRVEISGEVDFLLPGEQALAVRAAGQLPTGFNPEALYPARSHPRGLQLAIFAASDALGSLGLDWGQLCARLAADQVSVYAGSAMGQLDDHGNGGMLASRYRGKRVTSKHCPFGLADMPADFVNAYVLGNVGSTGAGIGACATFLYNLRLGIDDIRSGRARLVVVGAAEAPIVPDVMEGYIAMGALGTDAGLLALDAGRGLQRPDYRRACRPFSSNCGFTLAEGAQYVVLMDDELALETGASIHAGVPDVFVNADGHKKSISSPGVGNYLTMIKAAAAARGIVGEQALRQRSFVQAHGTGTPQNRVSESQILNETARLFGIESWPVAAIKAYLGHTIASASGDQMVTTLGVWADGVIPGVRTIDHVADDVHHNHLRIGPEHIEVGARGIDVAILNAKGFGGNNASATVLAPHVVEVMLGNHHGAAAMRAWRERNEAVRARADAYDEAACAGRLEVIYRFDHEVMDGDDLNLSPSAIGVPGFGPAIDLEVESPYAAWLRADSD